MTFGAPKNDKVTFGAPKGDKVTFGAPKTEVTFGNANSKVTFGAPSKEVTFGAPKNEATFGSVNSQVTFGAPKSTDESKPSQGFSGFGQSSESAQKPSVFGQSEAQKPSVFGQSEAQKPSVFGQSEAQKPSVFGQSTPSTFGGFGFTSPSKSVFGQNSPFGKTAQHSAADESQGSSVFGTPQSQVYASPANKNVFESSQFNPFTTPPTVAISDKITLDVGDDYQIADEGIYLFFDLFLYYV